MECAYSFVPSSPDIVNALRDRVGSEITWVLKHGGTEWRGSAVVLSLAPPWGPGDAVELVFEVPDLVDEDMREVVPQDLRTVMDRARREAAAAWEVDLNALPDDRLHELDNRHEPILLLEVPTSAGSVLEVSPRAAT